MYDISEDDRVTELKIGENTILKIDPESDWVMTKVFYPDATHVSDMKTLTIVIEKKETDDG